MKYKYLLFDADDTLLDFAKCEATALEIALSNSPIEFSKELWGKYHKINDDLWKDLEKGLVTRDIIKTERFKRLFNACGVFDESYLISAKAYENALACQVFEIDGAWELLEKLSAKYDICIITNGITAVQQNRFSISRLGNMVKKVYISEQMGTAKPSPLFFEKVLDDIGDSDTEKYLVIGDSLTSDIDGAINAGLDCIWYSKGASDPNGRRPTYAVSDLSEICRILL